MSTEYRQKGISLIELIMFIVIVSVGIAGILSVMNVTSQASADPMLRKQALAIAESLLEEITLQPFTYCDPDDPAATIAINTADCATPEAFGTEGGESRYSAAQPFDNVSDYGSAAGSGVANPLLPSPPGILGLDGVVIPGLGAYSATVTISNDAQGGIPAADALRIDVRVQGPGNTDVTLSGYRFRYAPRTAA